MGVEKWHGRTLDQKPMLFSAVEAKGLILNFYSPTCGPCIDELPSMSLLYKEALKRGYAMFMAVDGHPSASGIELPATDPKAFDALRARLEADIRKYSIEVPVVIMDTDFSIGSDEMITGTPEALFFKTKPLVLEYDLVGPVSTADERTAPLDPRYQFAVDRIK
ncbi:MAG: redoxin domain-containing protein [Spirochaetia bacterium]|nr:redoxin domain-containing protein [Spirochaetia bacterium]